MFNPGKLISAVEKRALLETLTVQSYGSTSSVATDLSILKCDILVIDI